MKSLVFPTFEFYYDSSSRRKLQSSTTYSSSSSSSTSSDYYVYDDTTMASSDDVYYDTMDSLTDQYATGDLFLTIAQGAYSLTEIEDIDPLEIGTLLGNFGGFWGKYNDEPTLRARGFVETFRLGKSQSSTKKRKLNSGSVQSMPDASVHDEGHQNMGNARRAFSDSGKGGRQNFFLFARIRGERRTCRKLKRGDKRGGSAYVTSDHFTPIDAPSVTDPTTSMRFKEEAGPASTQ
eukprot:jgi/Undpi1/2377/HiC_scaffold_13.g05758.m1